MPCFYISVSIRSFTTNVRVHMSNKQESVCFEGCIKSRRPEGSSEYGVMGGGNSSHAPMPPSGKREKPLVNPDHLDPGRRSDSCTLQVIANISNKLGSK